MAFPKDGMARNTEPGKAYRKADAWSNRQNMSTLFQPILAARLDVCIRFWNESAAPWFAHGIWLAESDRTVRGREAQRREICVRVRSGSHVTMVRLGSYQ